jgi:hypothetical protein
VDEKMVEERVQKVAPIIDDFCVDLTPEEAAYFFERIKAHYDNTLMDLKATLDVLKGV